MKEKNLFQRSGEVVIWKSVTFQFVVLDINYEVKF